MSIGTKPEILLINAKNTHQDDVASVMKELPQYDLVRITGDEIDGIFEKHEPDLVITDLAELGQTEIQMLSSLRNQDSSVPVIVVSTELDPEIMRHLFKFNVQDWLKKPFRADELIASVKSSVRSKKVNNNRVHAIVSAVGGAGATTTAISMTDIVVNKVLKKKKASVALFDLDFSTGNCSYVLDMINGFNLGSVVATPRRIDSEFIRVIQQKHEGGFHVYSFKRPELNTDLNGYELVLRLLDAVNMEHDHTFLDVPYYETEWKDEVLSAVNTCTIVTELNLPAIKHTLDVIARVKDLRGKDFPVQVLINKYAGGLFGGRISKGRLRELFEGTPFYYLPDEASVIGEAADRGMLPSEVSSRNKFEKSLAKYVKTIDLVEPKTAS